MPNTRRQAAKSNLQSNVLQGNKQNVSVNNNRVQIQNVPINRVANNNVINYNDKFNIKSKSKKIKRQPMRKMLKEYYILNNDSVKGISHTGEMYDLLDDPYDKKNIIDFDNTLDVKNRVEEIKAIRDLKPDEYISNTDIAKLVGILGALGAASYINKNHTNWFSRTADSFSNTYGDDVSKYVNDNKEGIASGVLKSAIGYATSGVGYLASAAGFVGSKLFASKP